MAGAAYSRNFIAKPNGLPLPNVGGTYTLDGGFWGIVAAVQTPGSPLLRVELTGTNTVLIVCPAPSGGFALQQNSDLNTVSWTGVTNVPVVVGGEDQLIISQPDGSRFYRLKY